MLDSNPNWLAHCTEIKDLAKSMKKIYLSDKQL